MDIRRLRISTSHCGCFMIDNVDVVKLRVAMAIHWSSPQRGSLLRHHLKRGKRVPMGSARASSLSTRALVYTQQIASQCYDRYKPRAMSLPLLSLDSVCKCALLLTPWSPKARFKIKTGGGGVPLSQTKQKLTGREGTRLQPRTTQEQHLPIRHAGRPADLWKPPCGFPTVYTMWTYSNNEIHSVFSMSHVVHLP